MKRATFVPALVMMVVVGLAGCAMAKEAPSAGEAAKAGAPGPTTPAADQAKPSLPSTMRKVMRNAELSIEVASPAATESKVSSLVGRLGGYVASSERAGVVTFGIRAAGILLPLAVLFGLPVLGVVIWLRRRQRRLVSALSA